MMRGSKQRLRQCAAILGLLYILLLDPAIVVSAPLSVNDMHPEGGCYYNLELYDHGEQIRTNEPCLNCTCTNHMLMCYLNTCPYSKPLGSDCEVERLDGQCCPSIKCPEVPVFIPDSQPFVSVGKPPTTPVPPPPPPTTAISLDIGGSKEGCYFDEILYPEGHLLPSVDPCELCYCIRNHSACVIQNCTLQIPGCTPHYNQGTCCPVSYDCENNLDSTTTTSTVLPTTGCYVDDIFYYDGSIINTGGPCQHCYCMKGEVICAVQECTAPEMDGCTAILGEDRCCPFKYECPFTEAPVATEVDIIGDDIVTTAAPGWGINDVDAEDREKQTLPPADVPTSKPLYPLDDGPLEATSQPPTISDETDDDTRITTEVSRLTTDLTGENFPGLVTGDAKLEATRKPETADTKIDVSTTEMAVVATDDVSLKKEETTVEQQITTQKAVLSDSTKDTYPLFDDITAAVTSLQQAETTSSGTHQHGAEVEHVSTTELSSLTDELSYTPNTVNDDNLRDITESSSSSSSFSGAAEAKFSPEAIETTSESPGITLKHTEAIAEEATTEFQIKLQPQDSPTSDSPAVEEDLVTGTALLDVASTLQGDDDQDKEAIVTKESVDKMTTVAPDRTNTEVSYTVSLNESNAHPISRPTLDQAVSESRVEPTTELPLDSSKFTDAASNDPSDTSDQPVGNTSDTTVKHVSAEVETPLIPSSTTLPHQQDFTDAPATTRPPLDISLTDDPFAPKENDTVKIDVPVHYASTTFSSLAVVTDNVQASKDPTYLDGGYCLQDGIRFSHGETVPSKDFCQSNCSCQRSSIECQRVRCDIPELVKNLTCRELFEDGRCCPRYICGHTDTGHGILTSESQVTLSPLPTLGDASILKQDSMTTKIPGFATSPPPVAVNVSGNISSGISSTSQAPVVSAEAVTSDDETGKEGTVIPQSEVKQETTVIPEIDEDKQEPTVIPQKDEVIQETTVITQPDDVERETTLIPQKDEDEQMITDVQQVKLETTVVPQTEEVEQDSKVTPQSAAVETTVIPLVLDEVEYQTTISPPIDEEKITNRLEGLTSISPLISLFDTTPTMKEENVTEVAVTDEVTVNQTITDSAEVLHTTELTTVNSSLSPTHETADGTGMNITISDTSFVSVTTSAPIAIELTEAPLRHSEEPVYDKPIEGQTTFEAVTPHLPLTEEESTIAITQSPDLVLMGDEGLTTTEKVSVLDAAVTTVVADIVEVTDLNDNLENITQDESQAVTTESLLNLTANVSSLGETILNVPQMNDSQKDDKFPVSNVTLSVTSSPARYTEGTTTKPYFIVGDGNVTEENQEDLVTDPPIEVVVNATTPSLLLGSDATRLPIVKASTSVSGLKDDGLLTTMQAPQHVDNETLGVTEDVIQDNEFSITTTLQPAPPADDITVESTSMKEPTTHKYDIVSMTAPPEVGKHNVTEKPSDQQSPDEFSNETRPGYPANVTKPEHSANETILVGTTAKIPEDVVTEEPKEADKKTDSPVKDAEYTTIATMLTGILHTLTSPGAQLTAETRLPADEGVTLQVVSVNVTDEPVTATTVHHEITTLNESKSTDTLPSSSAPADTNLTSDHTLASTVPSVVTDHHRINVTASTELLPHLPTGGLDEHLEGVSPEAGIPITSENFTLEEGQCVYENRMYSSAQQIPREDPCDFCFCFRGDIICLQQSCPPPIDGCYEEAIPGFCCPRYECPVTAVTLNVTDPKTPPYPLTANRYRTVRALTQLQVVVCEFRKKFYNKGETIASASGPCMDCLCGEQGTMKCTPKKCQLDPLWQTLPNLRKVGTLGVTRLGRNRF